MTINWITSLGHYTSVVGRKERLMVNRGSMTGQIIEGPSDAIEDNDEMHYWDINLT